MTYISDVDQIYIPPAAALIPLYEELLADYPQLEGRVQRAEEIILKRRLNYDPAPRTWYVESDRDGGKIYLLIGQSCTCPDYNSNLSPVAGKHRWCKHKLAKRIYTEYLERQIQERLVSLTSPVEAAAGTLRTDGMRLYDAHQPRLICRIRHDHQRVIRLFDAYATHQFALWMRDQIVKPSEIQVLAVA